MLWYSKVVWIEGLFLRLYYLQQSDCYVEYLLDECVCLVLFYFWGFVDVEIDQDVG